jgi:outer membrane lipopolysaccharide assembly protein LptE/RlpB
MIKKKIIFISLIFFLNNCGFTPIYLNNTEVNFSIEQIDYLGDRELNNFLKINLNKYKNIESDNKIFIEVNSSYEKNILSKDGAGKVTNYQLLANVIFLIKPINKEIIITEKIIMDSKTDKFEEDRYERTMKQNFASSISNKLRSELTIINDL